MSSFGKRPPLKLWDRQGRLVFTADRHFKHQTPLKHNLPERSSPHSRKTVRFGNGLKRI